MSDFEWPDPVTSPAADILRTGMVSDQARADLAPDAAETEFVKRARLNGMDTGDFRKHSVERHRRHSPEGDPDCPMCVFTVDGFKTDNCRTCTAPIVWAATADGKAMPVDAPLTPGGNVVLAVGPAGTVTATVLDQDALFGDGPRHVSHFVTCPDADTWRSKRVGSR